MTHPYIIKDLLTKKNISDHMVQQILQLCILSSHPLSASINTRTERGMMSTYLRLNRDQFYVSGYFEPRLENRRDPKVHSCVWLNWANPHCNWIPSLFTTNCHLGPDECTFCVSTMAMQGVSARKVIRNLMQEIVVWRWVSNILCAVKISSTCDNFIEHLKEEAVVLVVLGTPFEVHWPGCPYIDR